MVKRSVSRQRRKPVQPVTASRYFIGLDEAAKTLDMSYFTLRDWALEGRIATHKFGSSVKISNLELDRIISEAERPRVA